MKSYCILVKFDVFFLCGWSKNCENRVNYLKYKCVFGCNIIKYKGCCIKDGEGYEKLYYSDWRYGVVIRLFKERKDIEWI